MTSSPTQTSTHSPSRTATPSFTRSATTLASVTATPCIACSATFSATPTQPGPTLTPAATLTPMLAPTSEALPLAEQVIKIPNLISAGGGDLNISLQGVPGPAELLTYVNGVPLSVLFTGPIPPSGATVSWNPSGLIAPGTPFTLVLTDGLGRTFMRTFVYIE